MANGPILVVDDEPINLDALRHVLAQDYRLIFARNGHEALAAVAKYHPSLILMDIQMPEMNGYATCLALKANPETSSIPVIFVTSLSEAWDETMGFDCGAVDYIIKPISPPVVRARVKTHLSLVNASQLEQSYHDAIYMLGKAGHFNDTDTGLHIWRMAAYARELAASIGWNSQNCNNLELAAPMHDTGKIGIPGDILRKPGKLDAAEWEIMKTHTHIGHDILSKSHAPVFTLAAEIALRHHERWDGSGYPDGLAAEAIPESARIVALADVFDALTMKRPYKEAWPVDRVVATLQEGSGAHFEPRMVKTFVSNLPRILSIKAEWDIRETQYDGEYMADIRQWQAQSPVPAKARDVIRTHREWKVRFLTAITRREQLNASEIASDQCCEFGRWLHAEAKTGLGRLASYEPCVARHAAFHKEAWKIAVLVNAGKFSDANQMLIHGLSYANASEELASAAVALFKEAEATLRQ